MATPRTAATSGFVKLISASFKRACGLPPGPGGFFMKSSRSLPESPAPCQRTTRVRSSFAAPSSKSAMVPYIVEVSAFFFAGRFSWIRRMLPDRSARMSGMVLPSPSLELRGALLEERLRPLLLVVRPGAEAEEGRFQGQPFGLARLQSLVHRLERELHGERSVGKDLLQDHLRTRHQLRGGNDLVHEADAVRLLRADRCAGKNQLQRAAFTDQPREALCSAAARNDAQRNLGLAELRVLRGDPERASHGRLATAAERKAIDRGDHRLADILDQVENRLAERARLFSFDRRDTGQLVDVGSGDERLVAGPCKDDAAHGGVIPRVLEGRSEVLPGPPVQGVEHLRAIQRDVGDGALLLVEDVLEGVWRAHPHLLSDEGAEAGYGFPDDELLHLERALVGVERLGIREEPRHVVVEEDAVAAEQLPRPRDDLARADGGECLRERRVLVRHLPLLVELRHAKHHALAGGDVREHLREKVLDELEGADRLPELQSLLGVGDRVLERAHRAPRRHPSDAVARHAQDSRGVPERSVVLEPVRLGHPAVVERDQAVLDDAERDLVLHLLDAEAGRGLVLDDEALHLVVRDVARPDDRDVAPRGVADPLLLAVEHPGVALALRGRREAAARSGADQRLGQAEAPDLLEARHRREPLLLLLL